MSDKVFTILLTALVAMTMYLLYESVNADSQLNIKIGTAQTCEKGKSSTGTVTIYCWEK